MNDDTHQHEALDPNAPSNATLVIYLLSTFIAVTVIALTAMMMALGAGLGFESDDSAPQASMALWGISGLAFLPCMVLVIVLAGTHKRTIAVALGTTVIAAGMLAAIGWFIKSGGEMPGTTAGDVILLAVMIIPLIAGAIMIWRSSAFKS